MAETTAVACNQGDVGGLTLNQCGHDVVTSTLSSPETSGASELYVVTTILAVLSVVGTAGNALVLYVFSQKKDKLVSTLCIVVMASVDFITCLVIIPYTVFMEHASFHVHSDVVCKLYQFLITSNIPFSALIMVAISIDRYLCICHPFTRALNEVSITTESNCNNSSSVLNMQYSVAQCFGGRMIKIKKVKYIFIGGGGN